MLKKDLLLEDNASNIPDSIFQVYFFTFAGKRTNWHGMSALVLIL